MRRLAAWAVVAAVSAPAVAAPDIAATVTAIASIRSSTGASQAPDGKTIAYISNTSGSPQVWMLAGDGSRRAQVTNLPDPVQIGRAHV